MRPLAVFLAVFVSYASVVEAGPQDLQSMTIEQLEDASNSMHPMGFYFLSAKLFRDGDKDKAVFWFYVGQIRYRFHLAANPDLEKSGDPALFSSLQYVVGTEINGYAGGDVDRWMASINEALEWDTTQPNFFTSKSEFAIEYEEVVDGLKKLLIYLEDNKESIREQRASRNMDNR